MKEYLKPTAVMNFDTPEIAELAMGLTAGIETDKEKTVALFYFVRDMIAYKIFDVDLTINSFQATSTLERGHGFCIPKAVLLASFARAVKIPSRLHFADLRNHRLPEHLLKKLKTDIMAFHGYVELFFDNKWIAVNPAFDIKMCIRNDFIPVEFDGENDALFHHNDVNGNPHMEYKTDHGTFPDLPYEKVISAFRNTYEYLK